MTRRAFQAALLSFAVAFTILAAVLTSNAQQTKAIPRLCFLTFEPGTLASHSPRFEAFFVALRELGYVHGRNITIEFLSASANNDRFPELVAECLRLRPDVIAVTTTPAARLSKNATRDIPIVMVALGDPVGKGLVESLAKPGGNLTGMSQMVPELAAKRLALLKDAVPGITRVLVLTFLADPIAPLQVAALTKAAPSLGITLQVQDIRTAADLPAAFDAGVKQRAEGLLTTAESIFVLNGARVADLAAQHKLPAIYPYTMQVVDGGGLIAYDIVSADLHRRAAGYVDRVLKGAKASDLPVQQPTNFELVINQRAAKALGIAIPDKLLLTATKVIE